MRLDRDTEVEIEVTEREPRGDDDGKEEEEEVHEQANGERMRKIPHGPSPEEWGIHRITHRPYRSWCPKCVAGRGHQGAHVASEDPLDDTPMVSIDYCFLRRSSEDRSVPVLVAKVRQLNILFAHVVPFKGEVTGRWWLCWPRI